MVGGFSYFSRGSREWWVFVPLVIFFCGEVSNYLVTFLPVFRLIFVTNLFVQLFQPQPPMNIGKRG